MADIQMRFNKDMLVLSTAFDRIFEQQGFDRRREEAYVNLCEPELLDQAYQLESMIDTPCLCSATECITNARLSHERFDGQGQDIARTAWEAISAQNPQHAIAVIGPSGLPLDESSAASLKASRKQYQEAVSQLVQYPFDAIYFSEFENGFDAQCALIAARAVFDGPVFLSYNLTENGTLPSASHSLEDAVALADEYGASVIGICSGLSLEHLKPAIETLKQTTDKPLLVELVVRELIERALNPSQDNPYYSPDTMVEAAYKLHEWGIQFVRASGAASAAYTAALVGTLSGLDVVCGGGSSV